MINNQVSTLPPTSTGIVIPMLFVSVAAYASYTAIETDPLWPKVVSVLTEN